MKKLIAFYLAIASALFAAPTTPINNPFFTGNVILNGNIVVGNNTSITATGNGVIAATSVPGISINTTTPLQGGGSMASNLTLSMLLANSTTSGYLSSTDWTTFNAKQAAGNYITALNGDVSATGPGNTTATLTNIVTAGTVGSSTAIPIVTYDAKGRITGTSTAAVSATAGTLTTTTPLQGGGSMASNLTLSMLLANSTTSGYLSSTDWTTFNAKQAAGNYITALNGDVSATGPGNTTATLTNIVTAGTVGSSTAIPIVTYDAKGRITGTSTAAVSATTGAGTLTGTTLASNVIASSLTSVGNITGGTWSGNVIAGQYGGNGVANTGTTFTRGGNVTFSGAFDFTGTLTGTTSVTFPTSGTLATTAGTVPTTTTVNGHALSANVTVTSSDVGLGSVTNAAQTLASVVPNTIPTAGQIHVGNAGGTAFADVSVSGDATLASTGALTVTKTSGVAFATSATTDTTNAANITSGTLPNARIVALPNANLANSAITIAGTSTSLGGLITQDTITGLASTGLVKRTGANTLAIATSGTDYLPGWSGLTTNGLLQATGATTVASTLTPSGLTSLGVNGLTSASGQNLTLGTGTFGTALTFASATGAATFAGSILGSGGTAPTSTTTGSNIFTAGIATSGPIYSAAGNFSGVLTSTNTTDATTGGAGSLTTAGGIYAAKKIIGATGILSFSPTAGIGYATGAGGTVTQTTDRNTNVTLNKVSGAITLYYDMGNPNYWSEFTVTDSAVAATDTIVVNQKSGQDRYMIVVTNVSNGSFQIDFITLPIGTGGSTYESPVFQFTVIKGSNS